MRRSSIRMILLGLLLATTTADLCAQRLNSSTVTVPSRVYGTRQELATPLLFAQQVEEKNTSTQKNNKSENIFQSLLPNSNLIPKLLVADGRFDPAQSGDGSIADRFGRALDAAGDILVIGAPEKPIPALNVLAGHNNGVVYVYRRVAGVWQFEARINSVITLDSANFGAAVATDGTRIVVGAPGTKVETSPGNFVFSVGAAYVFVQVNNVWTQEAALTSDLDLSSAQFGFSVDIESDQIIVGEPFREQNGALNVGNAMIYERTGSAWNLQHRLIGSGAAECQIGFSVSLITNFALAGAPGCATATVLIAKKTGLSWQNEAVLTSTLVQSDARFGEALVIDGNTIAVGAPKQNVNGVVDEGAVVIYQNQLGVLTEQQILSGSNHIANNRFGAALDLQATRLLVGAPDANFFEGIGFVFDQVSNSFNETSSLNFSDGGFADQVGIEVALVDQDAFLGSDLDDVNPNRAQGSVKHFRLNNLAWSLIGQINRADGAANEQFGFSLDLDQDYAIVGSAFDDWKLNDADLDDADDRGSASIFRRDSNGWIRETILRANDGLPEDRFGISVAIDGNRAAVGAHFDIIDGQFNRGSVYLFERTGTTWVQTNKLFLPVGNANDFFGFQVALKGDLLVVSAPGLDTVGVDAGAAFVFTRGVAGWSLQQTLTQATWPAFGVAGIALASDGYRIAIGASDSDIDGDVQRGLVHVYVRDGNQFVPEQSVQASDGSAGDFFGFGVAIDRDQLLVGAPGDSTDATPDPILAHGSAYIFQFNGLTWAQQNKFLPTSLVAGDNTGTSVMLSTRNGYIGAPRRNAGNVFDRGEVLQFSRVSPQFLSLVNLLPPANEIGSHFRFGRSLATDGSSVLIGAPDKPSLGPREGAAYIFFDDDDVFADGFE